MITEKEIQNTIISRLSASVSLQCSYMEAPLDLAGRLSEHDFHSSLIHT